MRVIQHAVERLAANPLLGRPCEEIRSGYRRHGAGSHTVYYRTFSDDDGGVLIDVIRVLHKSMDVDRHLD